MESWISGRICAPCAPDTLFRGLKSGYGEETNDVIGRSGMMDWTTFEILSLGLGIGIGVGWFASRAKVGKAALDQAQGNADGTKTTGSGAIEPASNPAHSPESVDSIHAEIQALKEQLQRTQLAHQMAREMAQFQAGFLARTSHELRSPINSVISLHQLILADLAEDPVEEREFVSQANESAQKMLALLDQLISVSKATYGSVEVQLQALSLWEALAEVEQFTQLQARNRNLRLNIELPEPDILVWADCNWLRQVLLNLIDGPISLMQEGSIHLTTQSLPDRQQAQICIEDERPAHFWYEPIDLMTALKTNRPLEEFSRNAWLEARLQEPSPGLSLLITQTLLELMGGHLEVLSIPATEENPENTLTHIQCFLPLAKT
jgi:hypothetical protein